MIATQTQKNILSRFRIAEKAFRGTKYQAVLDECIECYAREQDAALEKAMEQFPSPEELFRSLLDTLSHPKPTGKPIFRTMRKIIEGKEVTREEKLKAYFSFCTHICIELEHGNKEYNMLLDTMYEKIGGLLYG